MLAALVLALAAGAAEPPAREPAAKLELFAKEDFYKNQKGKEEDFVGTLEKVKAPEVGFGRFNAFHLVMGDGDKKTTREVYVGGKTDILNDYVGKKIKLSGKAVDMEVEGTVHKEIWPARLELVVDKKEDKKENKADDKGPKILATAPWSSKQTAPRTVLIRSADGAAIALGVAPDKAKDEAVQKEATLFFAKTLKKDTIDWDKQMVLLVEAGQKNTGGYSVEVTGLEVKDKMLIVKWKVNAPKLDSIVTQAITHPATVVLVERFGGEIKFDPPADKPKDKDK